ncbi:alanine racemase [Maricaulis salignorans]|uniref:Alanine racemase n=1 Tax=Maricaulis salignorans TaxID=144026 RepID=A0A1G9T5M5_9PROT|nr:alanine racemase [Maricaulis salignorans]SDM43024.1 alanine racemase [Maricaulis salignorans]
MNDTKTDPAEPAAQPAPRLVIDLAAIQRNFAALQRLAPTARTGAVVKANAYGLGASRVIPALADAGCRTFYVAHTAEGREAREALDGREAEIFVFNGFWPSELASLREARLFPVINDLHQLHHLRDLAPDLPCAIHFDTGMNRLGLGPNATQSLLDNPDWLTGLDVRQIMSHLACSHEPAHPLNARQLERFAAVRAHFPDIPASFANSGGAMLDARYHFDVLRPGLALYGGHPAQDCDDPFVPAVRVEAPVLQVRTIRAGDCAGYGAIFTATREMRIATVATGYADGLLRACGDGGFGRIGGMKVPIIGRISMDLTTLDLSDVTAPVAPGDWVSFLGDDLEPMAAAAHTITYEFLVRLGLRFRRVYLPGTATAQ